MGRLALLGMVQPQCLATCVLLKAECRTRMSQGKPITCTLHFRVEHQQKACADTMTSNALLGHGVIQHTMMWCWDFLPRVCTTHRAVIRGICPH